MNESPKISNASSRVGGTDVLELAEKDKRKTWELKIVNAKELLPTQMLFAHGFYWAGFYGQQEAMDMFLSIGMSPFIKLIDQKNVIDAVIEGWNLDDLEYLIKDSRQQVKNELTNELEPSHQKYKMTHLTKE